MTLKDTSFLLSYTRFGYNSGGIKADRMETQAGDRKSPLQITAPKKAGPSIVESSWSRSRKKYRKYKERRKISFVGLDTTNPRNESRGLVVMPDFTNCRTM